LFSEEPPWVSRRRGGTEVGPNGMAPNGTAVEWQRKR
jgi:hypothetical protein